MTRGSFTAVPPNTARSCVKTSATGCLKCAGKSGHESENVPLFRILLRGPKGPDPEGIVEHRPAFQCRDSEISFDPVPQGLAE